MMMLMSKDELRRVISSLDPLYTREEAEEWMTSLHPLLDDRRPMDCAFAEVEQVVDLVSSGAFV